MQIGKAAKLSGLTAKAIRRYEAMDLLPRAERAASNYRDYDTNDVQRLRFVKRARSLGFAFDEIRSLLALWEDRERSNARVKELALKHARELEEKARALRDLAAMVRGLAEACSGDGRPDCPILDRLQA